MTLTAQYVEGYADRHKLIENLTYWEKQNQVANWLAIMTLDSHLTGTDIQALEIPYVLGHFIINDKILMIVDQKLLHQQLAESQQRDRVCWMFDISIVQYTTIKWEWIQWTQQQNSKSLVWWLFKISNKSAPTSRQHFVRQEIDSDLCLFCNESDTSFHCLTCSAHVAARKFQWEDLLQQVGRIVDQPVILYQICRLIYGEACLDVAEQ